MVHIRKTAFVLTVLVLSLALVTADDPISNPTDNASNDNSIPSTSPSTNNGDSSSPSVPTGSGDSSSPSTSTGGTSNNNPSTTPTGNSGSSNNNPSQGTGSTGSTSTTPSTPTTPTTPTIPSTPSTNAPARSKNDINTKTFIATCLKVHNRERALLGIGPLVWSDSLARTARAWSENMAKSTFRHSRGPYGENIASNTFSTNTLSILLDQWVREKNWYISGCKYGACSSNGKEVGHYTQMIWKKTTQVGCGFAAGYNRRFTYLTCQYLKPGNVVGQPAF